MAEVDLMNKSGIYQIKNLINGLIYIGSATKFRKRRDLHNLYLRNNTHVSKHLQRSWNKYGFEIFEFSILEVVNDKTKLLEREQWWLDITQSYNPKNGYNLQKVAGSNLGLKFSKEHIAKIVAANTGKKRSQETCIKIGLAKKGRKLTEELKQARRDYRHTKEAREKISNALYRRHALNLTSNPIILEY